ncbi:DUF3152 domain-containing protein [Streptomyces sp. NRRL S-244]|uniref:DUF3152 domain-containing protein n=1 Tax=Streptomyces sp. NRRL S-244 TaxID=1463897 RepID=UPI00068FDCFF|nr:DUF3152 domain-containing protein [Streptomyces sp. NRRL S-244]
MKRPGNGRRGAGLRNFLGITGSLVAAWWCLSSATPSPLPSPDTEQQAVQAVRPPEPAAPVDDGRPRRPPLDRALALSGAFAAMPGGDQPVPVREGGSRLRYRVDVEDGLAALGFDGQRFAAFVHETLNDPRSWSRGGNGGDQVFERVFSPDADFVVTLASPGTVDAWCARAGLDTSEQTVSCDAHNTERVMINAYRWAQGSPTYGDDMTGYRQMVVNHEVGHRIGYDHASCGASGAPAPLMMQQTKTLSSGDATCVPNPWPYP